MGLSVTHSDTRMFWWWSGLESWNLAGRRILPEGLDMCVCVTFTPSQVLFPSTTLSNNNNQQSDNGVSLDICM